MHRHTLYHDIANVLQEVELDEQLLTNAELSIEDILQMARDNPDSEIYIPSNYSEKFSFLFNQPDEVSL